MFSRRPAVILRLHQPAQGRELGGRSHPARGGAWSSSPASARATTGSAPGRRHVLAVLAPRMPGDDLAAAADHHPVDIAPHPHIPVGVRDRHRVVVGLVPHQRQRADPSGRLSAGVERAAGGRSAIASRSRASRAPILSAWPAGSPPGACVPTGQTHLPIQLQAENAPALPAAGKGQSGRLYAARSKPTPPQPWQTVTLRRGPPAQGGDVAATCPYGQS